MNKLLGFAFACFAVGCGVEMEAEDEALDIEESALGYHADDLADEKASLRKSLDAAAARATRECGNPGFVGPTAPTRVILIVNSSGQKRRVEFQPARSDAAAACTEAIFMSDVDSPVMGFWYKAKAWVVLAPR